VQEIVTAYSKVIGRELPHRFGERREGDVAVLTANPEKALKDLKWQTKRSLEAMCQDSWNFI
jgi:UDP-glucose 4-epimerase